MIRVLTALGLAAAAIVAMWAAIWGLIVTWYMASATAEDIAWRFTIGVLAFACGGVALALVGFAGLTLAPVVRSLCDKIVRTPS